MLVALSSATGIEVKGHHDDNRLLSDIFIPCTVFLIMTRIVNLPIKSCIISFQIAVCKIVFLKLRPLKSVQKKSTESDLTP